MTPDTFKVLKMIRSNTSRYFTMLIVLTIIALMSLGAAVIRLSQYEEYLKHDAIVHQEDFSK